MNKNTMTQFITNKTLRQRFQTTFDLHAMTVDPFKANGGLPWISTVGPLKTPTLLVTSDGDWFSGGLKWQLDRSVVQKPCEKQWVIANDFSLRLFILAKLNLPSSFHYYLFFEKKHTYIPLFWEDKISNIHFFHHLHCFLKKTPPETFHHHRIISNFSRDEWMDPNLTSPTANGGELSLRVCDWPWSGWNNGWNFETKKIRKGDGWLIGMKLNGKVPIPTDETWFFLFFWGMDGLVDWLVDVIHWFKKQVFVSAKKRRTKPGKHVGCGRFWMFVSTSKCVLSEKKSDIPLPKIDLCHPKRIKKSSKQQQLWTLRHSKTLWSLHPIVLGETRVFSKQI